MLVEKNSPPLLGFNNNVRHRGQVFHIQTEDSGVKHARIMTHLFADGGRIVQTARTDYSEHLGRDDMVEVVRQIMKDQHKAMFVRLRAGLLDDEIEGACGPLPVPAPTRVTMPFEPAAASTTRRAVDLPVASNAERRTDTEAAPEPAPERPSNRAHSLSNPSLRKVVPSVAPPANGELEFDVAALDEDPQTQPMSRRAATQGAAPRRVANRETSEEDARYAHSRPAAIFGELPQPGASIFGGQMSEKSLDEVILSYLAEDLEDGR
ncbi:MAG: hypothetical protein JW751_31745 [Polyangiaceae bacterium]|nr:hypothetical protein [Polyangiaceae bacterium]